MADANRSNPNKNPLSGQKPGEQRPENPNREYRGEQTPSSSNDRNPRRNDPQRPDEDLEQGSETDEVRR